MQFFSYFFPFRSASSSLCVFCFSVVSLRALFKLHPSLSCDILAICYLNRSLFSYLEDTHICITTFEPNAIMNFVVCQRVFFLLLLLFRLCVVKCAIRRLKTLTQQWIYTNRQKHSLPSSVSVAPDHHLSTHFRFENHVVWCVCVRVYLRFFFIEKPLNSEHYAFGRFVSSVFFHCLLLLLAFSASFLSDFS